MVSRDSIIYVHRMLYIICIPKLCDLIMNVAKNLKTVEMSHRQKQQQIGQMNFKISITKSFNMTR